MKTYTRIVVAHTDFDSGLWDVTVLEPGVGWRTLVASPTNHVWDPERWHFGSREAATLAAKGVQRLLAKLGQPAIPDVEVYDHHWYFLHTLHHTDGELAERIAAEPVREAVAA